MNNTAIKFSKEDLNLVENIINRFDPKSTSIKEIMFELNIGNLQRHVFKHPEIVNRKFAFKLTQEEGPIGFNPSSSDDTSDFFKTEIPAGLLPNKLKEGLFHNFEYIYKFAKYEIGPNTSVYYQRFRVGRYDPNNPSLLVDPLWLEEKQKKTGAHPEVIKQMAYDIAVIRKKNDAMKSDFDVSSRGFSRRGPMPYQHAERVRSPFGQDFEEYMKRKNSEIRNNILAQSPPEPVRSFGSTKRPSLKKMLFPGSEEKKVVESDDEIDF